MWRILCIPYFFNVPCMNEIHTGRICFIYKQISVNHSLFNKNNLNKYYKEKV